MDNLIIDIDESELLPNFHNSMTNLIKTVDKDHIVNKLRKDPKILLKVPDVNKLMEDYYELCEEMERKEKS